MSSQAPAIPYDHATFLETAAIVVRPAKLRSYEMMRLAPGLRVLEVGCGPGTDTLAMAEIVGETGIVIGVDADTEMLLAAERNAVKAGVSHFVRHRRANGVQLPFRNGEFDACRTERTFQHLADPAAALAEMARVTSPGGRVVVVETDWATLSVDTDMHDVELALKYEMTHSVMENPFAGRQLYRLFRRQGLREVEILLASFYITSYSLAHILGRMEKTEAAALTRGSIAPERLAEWHNSLIQADHEGTFFVTAQMVIAAGTVPVP